MSNEASKYTKSATVERAREMLKRLHDRNQRKWDDLDRDVVFAIEALIASAERYRFIAHGMQAEQAQPVAWKDAVMEQAQVFASAWSLVGGRFDNGSGMEDAEQAKAELQAMLTTPPPRQPLTDEQIDEIADEFIVDYRIPAGSHYDFARYIEAAHGIRSNDAA